jgi:hypothetical protein
MQHSIHTLYWATLNHRTSTNAVGANIANNAQCRQAPLRVPSPEVCRNHPNSAQCKLLQKYNYLGEAVSSIQNLA